MRHLLKRPFSLPKADGLAVSARVEVRPRPDPLGWLAEELGVVDRHSVWQWVLFYLFILQIVPHALKLPPETRFLSCWFELLACYFQSQCGFYWQAFRSCAGFGSGYFLFCRQ